MNELQKLLSEINSEILTEENKTSISDLFEAVIAKKTGDIKKELQEQHDAKIEDLEKSFKEFKEEREAELEDKAVSYVDSELFENFNDYINHVAEEFVKENKLVLSEGVKAEKFDSIVESVRTVLAENSIPEKEINIESFNDQINSLKESLEAKEKELMKKNDELKKKDVEEVFSEVSEGLTDIQKSKLRTIIEDYSVTDLVEFKRKVSVAKGLVVKEETNPADENPDMSSDTPVDDEVKPETELDESLFDDEDTEDIYGKILEKINNKK